MHEFFEFLMQYWYLSSLFLILFVSLIIYEAKSQGYGSRLTAQALVHTINAERSLVFDVRSSSDFEKGHILHSKSITPSDLSRDLSTLVRTDGGDEKDVVLVCSNGQKSGKLQAQLKRQNKSINITLLAGGLNEWKRQNLPLKKGRK